MLIRLLALLSLLFNRIILDIIAFILDVESLEKAMEIQVIQVIRTQRKFWDNQLYILVF